MIKLILFALVLLLVIAACTVILETASAFVEMARSVLRRAAPFLLALAAALFAFSLTDSLTWQFFDEESVLWIRLSLSVAIFVGSYLLLRRLFSRSAPHKFEPQDKIFENNRVVTNQEFPSGKTFEPLIAPRRIWRKRVVSDAARFEHVIRYLSTTIPEERPSLEFSEGAILKLWDRTANSLDPEAIGIRSRIQLWVKESERFLANRREGSRAQYLLKCERLIQSLERIAVRCRGYISNEDDDGANGQRLRTEYLGRL